MKNTLLKTISLALFFYVLGGIGSAMAQIPIPGFPRPFDGLAPLRSALEDAGAPPLSPAEEQQLRAIVLAFQTSLLPQDQGAALRTANRRYEDAVMAADLAAASAQAAAIAKLITDQTSSRLQAEANFKIQILNILKSNDDQIGLLLKRSGTAGVYRLISSLLTSIGLLQPFPGGPIFLGKEAIEEPKWERSKQN
ncbi:MAG TPA: hypothetical protein VGQ81_07530 [Acidobacteriota bacterium]|jgi:hypothetical protein|nr:hypothetical protein [Acidobacteriota bacterium]